MNMTTLRQKSKIFIWVVLSGFLLSLVGVMGSAGGGFLGGASLTSFFSTSLNTNLYVGKVGNKKITRNELGLEIQNQKRSQFQANASEVYYITSAWNQIIKNTIINKKIDELNLKTQELEIKNFLYENPPAALQRFLIDSTQNRLGTFFKNADGEFDLDEYKFTIDNNINWMPNDLISIMMGYENDLKKDLPNQKLVNLYNKLTHVSDNYINENIINNNTKCNIDILSINFSEINDSLINISQSDIEQYYNNNKDDKYIIPESVSLEYVNFENIEDEDDSLEIILNEDQKQTSIDFALDCTDMSFSEAVNNYNIEVKDTLRITEGFSNNSGIPLDMGYDRRIVRFAFDNSNNTISDRIATNNGNAIFHIISRDSEKYKSISEVETEIKDFLLNERKKEFAQNQIEKMLQTHSDLNKISESCKYCTLNESEESTLSGSFNTTGKNYKVMGALSVLNNGEKSKIIDSNNTLYILKLNNKYDLEESIISENFNSSKESILNNLYRNVYNGWMNYMTKNTKKIDLKHRAI